MNCYDCAAHGRATAAVAVCPDCGAAVCADHAVLNPRWLTRTMAIGRVVPVEPPTRIIRCRACATARHEAHGYDHAPARR